MSAPDCAFTALWDCRLGLSSTEVPSMVVDIIWSVNVFFFLCLWEQEWVTRLRGCQCCAQCDAPNIFQPVFGSLTVLCPVLADGDTCDPRTVVYSLRRPLLSGHFTSCLKKN